MLWAHTCVRIIADSLSKINRNGWSCNVITNYADSFSSHYYLHMHLLYNLLGILTKVRHVLI